MYLMPSSVKTNIAIFSIISLVVMSSLAHAAQTGTTVMLPATVSPTVTRVVESTVNTGSGESALPQDEVSEALAKLVQIYERRVTRLQDEINRLRLENEGLKTKLGLTNSTGSAATTSTGTAASGLSASTATPAAKTETEKRYDIIVSNIVAGLPELLKKNNISATGSIGVFEFIEPKNFFISIDDGKNPAGVTAFKTKVLFEYDANLNLKVIGVFNLDYATSRYITARGNNPFAGVARVRVKNPSYVGKLLDEPAAQPVVSTISNLTGAGTTAPATGGSAAVTTDTSTPATLEEIRKAYEKNKLGDVVRMSSQYLQTNPGNIEVLTMRARSQYIFSKFNEALSDINAIYKIQGESIDCGIINDGARAEKALKGAQGNTFGGLQTTKCKK